MGNGLRIVGALLVLLGASVSALLGTAPAWLPVAYLMLGLTGFVVYGIDKRAARRGDWRVTEAALHGIDAIGGIAGGLIGQALFRHKTRKEPFVVATAFITGYHVVGLATLALGLWRFPDFLF